jgi:selenide,water dikinase
VTTRLLLVGLGHAHLFVLEAAARGRLPGVALSVCMGEDEHVYSGMVPGWIRDRYRADELALDVDALCAWAGAARVPQPVTGVDAARCVVQLADGDTVGFDRCSIAVGSRPAGRDTVPGVAEHALTLKPLATVATLRERVDVLAASGGGAITIVGGGLAGIEVAFALRARLDAARERSSSAPHRCSIAVLTQDASLLSARPRLAARVRHALARREITLHTGADVVGVDASAVALASGTRVPSALTIWATGASPPAWFRSSGLATDARGFLRVNGHLQVEGTPHVFAAGDCASLADWPDTPKAGVFAVRMGPVLARTLAAAVEGRPLPPPYTPQRHYLTLVDTGDGRAIASRGAWTAEGRWVAWWKDQLDRRFVARFQRPARRAT